jgi:hypothetical protein
MLDQPTSHAAALADLIAKHAASVEADPPRDIPQITQVVFSLQLALASMSKTVDGFERHVSEQLSLGFVGPSASADKDASAPLQAMYAKGALYRASLMATEMARRLYEAMEHLGQVTDLPVTDCDVSR